MGTQTKIGDRLSERHRGAERIQQLRGARARNWAVPQPGPARAESHGARSCRHRSCCPSHTGSMCRGRGALQDSAVTGVEPAQLVEWPRWFTEIAAVDPASDHDRRHADCGRGRTHAARSSRLGSGHARQDRCLPFLVRTITFRIGTVTAEALLDHHSPDQAGFAERPDLSCPKGVRGSPTRERTPRRPRLRPGRSLLRPVAGPAGIVGTDGSAAPLPSDPQPVPEFVTVDRAGQQQPGCDQFVAEAHRWLGEPGAGEDAAGFGEAAGRGKERLLVERVCGWGD